MIRKLAIGLCCHSAAIKKTLLKIRLNSETKKEF